MGLGCFCGLEHGAAALLELQGQAASPAALHKMGKETGMAVSSAAWI